MRMWVDEPYVNSTFFPYLLSLFSVCSSDWMPVENVASLKTLDVP